MGELVSGQLVGEYRVEHKLGEGTFGKVYAAQHPVIGKRAAIKVLNPEFSAQPEMVSRFVSEARAVNQIRHRNIIDIFSFGRLDDGQHYFVMELLEGMTLEDYLQRHGALPLDRALPIFDGIARALAAAHKQGIAHRDLKPENVFINIDEEGQTFVKLLDFGIAKLLGDTASGHRTATGVPIGTPLYMSPEQCKGGDIDHRTDIYAFGVIVHEVLTGHRPFDGTNVMEVMMAHLSADPPPVSTMRHGLPPALDAPVQHMMAKEREHRPPEIRGALRALVEAARRAGSGAPGRDGADGAASNAGDAVQATADFSLEQSSPIAGAGSMSGGGLPQGYPPMPATQPGMPVDAQARAGRQPQTVESHAHPGPGMTAPAHGAPAMTAPGGSSMGGVSGPTPAKRGGGFWVVLGLVLLGVVGGGVWFATSDPARTDAVDEDEEREEDDERVEDDDQEDDEDDDAVQIATAPLPAGATFDAEHQTVITGSVTGDGGTVKFTITSTQHRSLEALSSDDHRIQRAKVSYRRYDSTYEVSIAGRAQPIETETEPTAHRTFVVASDGGRTLTATEGGQAVPAALQQTLQEELLHNFVVRPNLFPRALAIGDEMNPPGAVMVELMRSTAGGEGVSFEESTLTFQRVETKAGREVAVFAVKTTMVEKNDTADLTAPLEGTVEFDVETGWPVSANAKGPFQGHIIESGQRMPSSGQVEVKTEGRIVGGS